ncbi:MAG: gamma-glutamylcyclotransferase [Pseudomonadota bacterium]
MSAATRLATYGTLAPGEVNHGVLDGLSGTWTRGSVRGRLFKEGWGAAHGCPGMIPDPDGERIAVHVFESPDLPEHWARLDAFEGDEYRRVTISVETEDGALEASIYRVLSSTE